MKIKLLNGTEYAVVGATTKGNTLEIQLNKSVLTAEGAEEAFQDRAPLGKIEVYETTKKTSTLLGYVVLAEVRLKAGVVTVVLTKEADKTEQRITDAAAKARQVFVFKVKTGITHSLNASGHTEVQEFVIATSILCRDVLGNIEVLNFTGHLATQSAGVKLRDVGDTGHTGQSVLPTGFDIVADRANHTETRYYDTTHLKTPKQKKSPSTCSSLSTVLRGYRHNLFRKD